MLGVVPLTITPSDALGKLVFSIPRLWALWSRDPASQKGRLSPGDTIQTPLNMNSCLSAGPFRLPLSPGVIGPEHQEAVG